MSIHPQLLRQRVAIDDIAPHPRNPRHGNVELIEQSLKRNGQYKPIIVQSSTNHILAGNHTWKAAKKLGWADIAAIKIDVDDKTATRILLADNRTSDLASYDDEILKDILAELDNDLEGSGYETLIVEPETESQPETTFKTLCAVMVDCQDETDQLALIKRLTIEGYECRAID